MMTSRLPGFRKMSVIERLDKLAELCGLNVDDMRTFTADSLAALSRADKMVENAVGIHALPFGLGLNFRINDRDYLVPMVIEEPSVVASASYMAKLVRQSGGFYASADDRLMIGQIQVMHCPDLNAAQNVVLANTRRLLAVANAAQPRMAARGGGAQGIETRILRPASITDTPAMLVVHILIDTKDAMGANTVNAMAEAVAPLVEELTGGTVYLRILSNYADRCLARARCAIPPNLLAAGDLSGFQVRDRIIAAYEFAALDVYRAVTHNKGVMNGIDAVAIATGNDWRAIEAGAHAYAARFGYYGPMTSWTRDDLGNLVGTIELPMPVGIVGGATAATPSVRLAQKILGVDSAAELAQVAVSVGLAQNLGALRALVTEGIQRGHMALHARTVALTAGAQGDLIDQVAQELIHLKNFSLDTAKTLLELIKRSNV